MIKSLFIQTTTFETIPSKYSVPFGSKETNDRGDIDDIIDVWVVIPAALSFDPTDEGTHQLPSFTMTKTCRQLPYDVRDYIRDKRVLI